MPVRRHSAGTGGGVGGRFREGAHAADVDASSRLNLTSQAGGSIATASSPKHRPQNRKEMRYAVAMAVPDGGVTTRKELLNRVRDNMSLQRLRGSTRRHVEQSIEWNVAHGRMTEDDDGNLRLSAEKSSYSTDTFKDQRQLPANAGAFRAMPSRPQSHTEWRQDVFKAVPEDESLKPDDLRERIKWEMSLNRPVGSPLVQKVDQERTDDKIDQAITWNLNEGTLRKTQSGHIQRSSYRSPTRRRMHRAMTSFSTPRRALAGYATGHVVSTAAITYVGATGLASYMQIPSLQGAVIGAGAGLLLNAGSSFVGRFFGR